MENGMWNYPRKDPPSAGLLDYSIFQIPSAPPKTAGPSPYSPQGKRGGFRAEYGGRLHKNEQRKNEGLWGKG